MTLLDARGNIIISAETKAAQKALDETAKKTNQLTKELRKAELRSKALTSAANKMGAGLLVGAAAGAALLGNSIRLAARTQTLGVVVNTLGRTAGYTADEMDALTQKVVDQGITLRHSRTAISMMAQANIDLAKSSDLARLAQDAAVIANLNSSETFQRLIQVIQTGNIRMARHLGLVVDFQRAYMDFADANNTTTDALTQQQKAQIRVTEVMRAGTAIAGTYEAAMETAGKKVLSLERHLEESSRIIGELFLPAFADAVDSATTFLQAIQSMDEGQRASLSTTLLMSTGFMALAGGILRLRGPFLALTGWITTAGTATAIATGGLTILAAALAAFITMSVAATKATEANVEAVDALVQKAIEEGATLEEVNRLIEDEAIARDMAVKTLEDYETATLQGAYASGELKNALLEMTAEQHAAIVAMDLLDREVIDADNAMSTFAETMQRQKSYVKDFGSALDGLGSSLKSYTIANVASSAIQDIMNSHIERGIPLGEEATGIIQGLFMAMGETPMAATEFIDIFNAGQDGAEKIELAMEGVNAGFEEVAEHTDTLSEGLINAQEEALLVGEYASSTEMWDAAVDYANTYAGKLQGGANAAYRAYRWLKKAKELESSWTAPVYASTGDTGLSENAEGGQMGPGWNLVGERGPELVLNGMVFDTATSMKLLASGMFSQVDKFGLAEGAGSVSIPTTTDFSFISDTPSLASEYASGRRGTGSAAGTGTRSTAVTASATSAAKSAIDAVAAEVGVLATAIPSSTDIAQGIQEAQLAQVQAGLRATQEQINLLEDLVILTAEAGTADDIGLSVRDNLASGIL